MNAGAIWWEQIGASRRFLNQIREKMEAASSAVLQLPRYTPWKNHFYTMVDLKRASFSGDRQMKRLEWAPGADPGAFILEHLCTRPVRADYFPGQTYAAYLGSRDDILLCDYYVWITGVESREDLARWTEFISEYNEYSGSFSKRAVYILEYTGAPAACGSIPCVAYSVEHLDRQAFCLELASELANASLRDFQAELALRIGGEDPELSAILISIGEAFVRDPIGVTQNLIREKRRSDYSRFSDFTRDQISSAVWKADIVLLFPILEQWRFDLVSKYEKVLRGYLPIRNSNGELVEEPFDLELGALLFIAAQNQPFTRSEYAQLSLCRSVRNKLAHNQVVPFDEAFAVLRLG